jgi:UDPglucose 6-dehydrogenase
MKIGVIGTGYVGLVLGTCLADLGNEVTCLDVIEEKIKKLQSGVPTIYEPGLSDLMKRNMGAGRLSFTTDAKMTVENSEVIFIAVGTPSKEDGSVNMDYISSAAETIGRHMNGYKVVVDKSTVPVGTHKLVERKIKESQAQEQPFDVVSNPEFLREGEAIKDFMNPDRVVVGVNGSEKARGLMENIYKGIVRTGKPILFTDVASAEMIKYASNAMLATRISFMNEVARLCEQCDADVKKVAQGMGLDDRIGPRFLQAGAGYGGSCFPKDVRGLIQTGKEHGVDFKILQAVDDVNEEQKTLIFPKIKALLPDLKDKKVAVWGLAFKPKTDDMREAPSMVIIDQLLAEGAKIKAFDPEAQEVARQMLGERIEFAATPMEAVQDADCLVLVTEWDEFRNLDKAKLLESMAKPNIVDARNVWGPKEMVALGFNYKAVGR